MRLIGMKFSKILIVVFIEDMEFIAYEPRVFFLEDLLEHSLRRLSVLIIATVFSHFIYEEERQALDAPLEELTLLFEMRLDGLADLDPLEVKQIGIAHYFPFAECDAVSEGDVSCRLNRSSGKYLGYVETSVLLQLV